MGLPYAFGSAPVPVKAGHQAFGTLAVAWSAPPGTVGLSKKQLRHLLGTADRLGAAFAALHAKRPPCWTAASYAPAVSTA
ncbi:hypothetical protein [Streptomyces sp. YGL11-2]|uniref:hypothetical protein n=1 Tax=Streptomyces sp. YGL11-2 TaxID=3414028 RepID=UPI003CED1122